MKKLFMFVCAALLSGSAMAQKITVEDVTIEPGGEAQLVIKAKAEAAPCGAGFKLFFKDSGVDIKKNDKGKITKAASYSRGDLIAENEDEIDYSITITEIEGGYDFTIIDQAENAAFQGNEGVLITLNLVAPEDATPGTYKAQITNAELLKSAVEAYEVDPVEFEFDITVAAPEIPFVEPEPLTGTLISSVFYGANPVLINGTAYSSEGYPFYFDNGWKPADSSMGLNGGALEITNPAAGNFMLMLLDWFNVKEQYDYKVRVFYTSTVDGKVNFTFGTWNDNVGASDVAIEASTDAWKELVIPFEAVGFEVTNGSAHLLLHFGLEGTIAIKKVEIYETEPAVPIPDPVWSNIVVNGNCATADNSAFSYKIKKQYYKAQIVDGDGVEGSRGVVVTSDDSPANDWDTQFFITINHKFAANEKFRLKMDYRADLEGDATATGQFQSHKACAAEMPEAGLTEADEVTDPETQHIGTYIGNISGFSNLTFKNDWQTFEGEGKATADMQSICLNLSVLRSSTKYYFDNIIVEIDENKATPEDLAVIGEVANEGEDVVTGIKSLNTAEKNGALYNLAGQKVDKNFKGIVIVNGKKMMMK